MHKFIIAITLMFIINLPSFCEIFQGGVAKEGILGQNKVVDLATNAPISGAKVSMPQENYKTYTDSDGNFSLGTNIGGQTVMSVEKPGYKPFSVTLDKKLDIQTNYFRHRKIDT